LAPHSGTTLTVTAAVCKGSFSPWFELDGVNSAVLMACTQLCMADGNNEHRNPIVQPMQLLESCGDCCIALSLAMVKMCMHVHHSSSLNWSHGDDHHGRLASICLQATVAAAVVADQGSGPAGGT
jgi:hypothetical protein